MTIPKIIHQIWIGPKTPPIKFMDTWKNKHENEGFEYIRWTEKEMKKRGFTSQLQDKINDMSEINGKADILRWEILYEYGGFFTDADAYCIEPITYLIENYKAFTGYENETVRNAGWCPPGHYDDVLATTHPLIATGTMAFPPKHELPRLAIEWIKNNDISIQRTRKRAWRTVGPGLLTRLYHGQKWKDITILPSHYFLPIHASGLEYKGPEKIYAYQEWGSTKESYANMNNVNLPNQFNKPVQSINIIVSSFNAKAREIKQCLDIISPQLKNVSLEIIWINNNSDVLHSTILKRMLYKFENTIRFVKKIYIENKETIDIYNCINKGLPLCKHNIVWKADIRNSVITNIQ